MQDVVRRILVVFDDAEDADYPVLQIAVFVEGDFALDGLDPASLYGVAYRLTCYLFTGSRDTLDRIENDQGRIIGGDRIILWRLPLFRCKTVGNRCSPGLLLHLVRLDR